MGTSRAARVHGLGDFCAQNSTKISNKKFEIFENQCAKKSAHNANPVAREENYAHRGSMVDILKTLSESVKLPDNIVRVRDIANYDPAYAFETAVAVHVAIELRKQLSDTSDIRLAAKVAVSENVKKAITIRNANTTITKIAENLIGWAKRHNLTFTTAYGTRDPESWIFYTINDAKTNRPIAIRISAPVKPHKALLEDGAVKSLFEDAAKAYATRQAQTPKA